MIRELSLPGDACRAAPASLVDRCREGEEAAWRELYEAHAGRVWRFAERLGARSEDLPDVLQEVFVVVFRRLPDFDGRAAFTTWLFGIVLKVVQSHRRRSLRQHLRRVMALTLGDPPTSHDDPESAAFRSAAARELKAILDQMSDPLREVFVLYEIEGLEGADIAAILECPEGTVRSRLRLARRRFQKLRRRRRVVGGEQ